MDHHSQSYSPSQQAQQPQSQTQQTQPEVRTVSDHKSQCTQFTAQQYQQQPRHITRTRIDTTMIQLGRRNSYDRTAIDEASSHHHAFIDDGMNAATAQQKAPANRRITDMTTCSTVVASLDFDDSDSDTDDCSSTMGPRAPSQKFVVWADEANTVHTIPHIDDVLEGTACASASGILTPPSAPITRESLWYSPRALDQTLAECIRAVDTPCMDAESATNDKRGLEFMTSHGLDISRHSRSIVLRVLEEQAVLRNQQRQSAQQSPSQPTLTDDQIATMLSEVYAMSSAHRQRVAHLMGMRDASDVQQIQAVEKRRFKRSLQSPRSRVSLPQLPSQMHEQQRQPNSASSNPWSRRTSMPSEPTVSEQNNSNPWASASTRASASAAAAATTTTVSDATQVDTMQTLLNAGAQERQRRRSMRSSNGGRFRQRHSHSGGNLQSNIQQAWKELSTTIHMESSDEEDNNHEPCEPAVTAAAVAAASAFAAAQQPSGMMTSGRRSSYSRRSSRMMMRRRCSVDVPNRPRQSS